MRSVFTIIKACGICLLGTSMLPAADAAFTYAAANTSITYQWTAPVPNTPNSLGTVHVSALIGNHPDTEIDLPLTFQSIGHNLRLQTYSKNTANDGTSSWTMNFATIGSTFNVTVTPYLIGKGLAIKMSSDVGASPTYSIGSWPSSYNPQYVSVPYYTDGATYLQGVGLFANAWLDHTASAGTYLNRQNPAQSEVYSSQSVYLTATDGSRRPGTEIFRVNISDSIGDVFPEINNPASPYLANVAGRPVLDVWNGTFQQINRNINKLVDFGLNRCAIIVHVWQRSGFDNALPAHYPANSALGTESVVQNLISSGNGAACEVALHENYQDYYPDYDSFTSSAIARDSQNGLQLGWFNAATGVQAYAAKPSLFVANATPESPVIHSRYGTSAGYIDVNSAQLPWSHVDMDASQSGSAAFATSYQASAALWGFERQSHGGPVFGEGLNHWYWSGLLDGVEAQLGAGFGQNSSSQVPLFVDFDLLRIHPLQTNHGMGYYSRWLASGQSISSTNLIDAYRMQELAYGHAPFVGDELWKLVPAVWTEQNLIGVVAQRYGTQSIQSLQYQVAGTWTGSGAAIAAGDWSRVQIAYSNGDTLVANSQASPLVWNGLTLPQYGWAASGNGLNAYSALLGSTIGDYAETTTSVFANARNQADLSKAGSAATPTASNFQQSSATTATVSLTWLPLEVPSNDTVFSFIHFVSTTGPAGSLAFQANDNLSSPVSQWKPGLSVLDRVSIVLPAGLADGSYNMMVGLASSSSGDRYPLYGTNDSVSRCMVGTLTISKGKMSFAIQAQPALNVDPRLNGPGTVLDFGKVRTDGIAWLNQNATTWTLRTYPRWRPVVVQLQASSFNAPSLTCDGGSTPAPLVKLVNGFWVFSLQGAKTCQFGK